MMYTYTERYEFPNIGEATIIGVYSSVSGLDGFDLSFFEKGNFEKEISSKRSLEITRGILQGFVDCLSQEKRKPIGILRDEDWLKYYCVEPNPRSSEEEILRGLS